MPVLPLSYVPLNRAGAEENERLRRIVAKWVLELGVKRK
jgi:hypothetical protein